jgi:hypothetical protein
MLDCGPRDHVRALFAPDISSLSRIGVVESLALNILGMGAGIFERAVASRY